MSIEPFRQEIAPNVFLIGAPLGTNIPGFAYIKIRDACNQDIPTWTCYNPKTGEDHPRVPINIADPTSCGWIVYTG